MGVDRVWVTVSCDGRDGKCGNVENIDISNDPTIDVGRAARREARTLGWRVGEDDRRLFFCPDCWLANKVGNLVAEIGVEDKQLIRARVLRGLDLWFQQCDSPDEKEPR